ncbi:primosomal protein N' [Capnocytophaga canimorsus]|uniref:replication restart helicase PriA n=1 Tax=Capnocytophaga canimorsus TaxID=28188 RepID=UPI00385F763B
MSFFVDVILPIPLSKLFTYSVNEHEAHFLKPGMRVAVSFGKTKIYAALVFRVHNEQPTYQTKDIEYILDEFPIVTSTQLAHWQWIADYYMCSLGEVYKAALPNAFLLESETVVEIAQKDLSTTQFSDEEYLVYEALNFKTSLKGQEITKILNKKKVLYVLKSLLEKNAIKISEKIFEKYVPKRIKYVRLAEKYQEENGLKQALDLLKNAPKQKQLILAYFNRNGREKTPIKSEELLEISKVSASVLKMAVEKGIFEEYYLQKDRFEFEGEIINQKQLTEIQGKTLLEIEQKFAEKQIVLLHGVTASGKTEIYVKLIDQVINQGKQVLYLLPEIAISTQLVSRLQRYFGDKIGVYHSKYSVNERVEVWNNVLHNSQKMKVILGVRSAVFLPFSDLGLIIVDEEHDASFRQIDPAPRFQARDTATILAKLHQCQLLLGSATPSIESLHNVANQKYGYVSLNQRYTSFQPPEIVLVDMKDKLRRKRIKGHFSDDLIQEMEQTLSKGKQVLLFQNRRGYAPVIQCKSCGTIPQCPNCDVSLTYHQGRNQLRCHYCGYAIAKSEICIACSSTDLITKGVGTEQIAQELLSLFPKITIDRMDQDTTQGKYGFQKILSDFEQQQTQILVGTQMITKGLDFSNVGLVGVINADMLIHAPDFRAHERSFQILMQVSGRAGRSAERGRVLIQTYNPSHIVLQQVLNHDFKGMYQTQTDERNEFAYPPFVRLIKITFKHTDFNKVNEGADWFAKALRNGFANQTDLQVLGPEFPLISRIRNEYIKDILVKIPLHLSFSKIKAFIIRTEKTFLAIAQFRSVRVIFHVD